MVKQENRELNIDYLRIFACFMVIFLHVSGQNFRTCELTSVQWKAFNLYDSAVRSCVPLFFMISGKLFLSKDKMCSLTTLFKKYIGKLVFLYFAWSFFYAVIRIGKPDSLNAAYFLLIFKEMIKSEFHLWYLPSLVGVYFLMPILWTIAKYEDGKYLKYVCIMFFCFGIVKNTLLEICLESHTLTSLLNKFSYALSGFSGYFLLGYYLDKYKQRFKNIKQKYLLLGLGIVIFMNAFLNYWHSLAIHKADTFLFDNQGLFSCVEAILIFMIFLKIPYHTADNRFYHIVTKISKYTLLVYLLHPFFIDIFEKYLHMTSMSMNAWISVPCLTIVIFSLCICVAFILEKIPIINRWFM